MIILNKKRLLLIISILLILIILVFLINILNNTKKETISTIALPVSNKVVVLDAGHGTPDERSRKC